MRGGCGGCGRLRRDVGDASREEEDGGGREA